MTNYLYPSAAVLYVRVSSAGQVVAGTSLSTQLSTCRSAAGRLGLQTVGEFVEAGASGARQSRPALDRLLQVVRAGQAATVVVAKLDRLGRSLSHLLTLLDEFNRLGVQVVAVDDGFDTGTATGRLQLSILGSVAEFERDRIRDRLMSGVRARAEQGGFVASRAPFGYRIVPDRARRGNVLEVDAVASATVRRLFELLVVQRCGPERTAQVLNAEGRRPARAAEWSGRLVTGWARGNGLQTATGMWRWSGIDVPVPPILTSQEAQLWRGWVDRSTGSRRPPSRYLLSGLLVGRCGQPYFGRQPNAAQQRVYVCRTRAERSKLDPARCQDVNVPAAWLDRRVWRQVTAHLADTESRQSLATAAMQVSDPGVAGERVTVLRAELVAAYEAALATGFDAATARSLIHTQQQALAAAIDAEEQARTFATVEQMQLVALVMASGGRGVSVAERRLVLQALGMRVTITGFRTCPGCAGRGYLKGRSAGTAPQRCPRCLCMRCFPVTTIQLAPARELSRLMQSGQADTASVQAKPPGKAAQTVETADPGTQRSTYLDDHDNDNHDEIQQADTVVSGRLTLR